MRFHPRNRQRQVAQSLAPSTKKKSLRMLSILQRLLGDPLGTRTQDPYIKSVLLYQLS